MGWICVRFGILTFQLWELGCNSYVSNLKYFVEFNKDLWYDLMLFRAHSYMSVYAFSFGGGY
jgi:hypothetical protein